MSNNIQAHLVLSFQSHSLVRSGSLSIERQNTHLTAGSKRPLEHHLCNMSTSQELIRPSTLSLAFLEPAWYPVV